MLMYLYALDRVRHKFCDEVELAAIVADISRRCANDRVKDLRHWVKNIKYSTSGTHLINPYAPIIDGIGGGGSGRN